MSTVTLGGERLGAGKKQKVHLHGYERSTHDLSYPWRSTMSAGTLVPFMAEVMLPGDTFDINLDCDIKTHPTVGPLFGSYKVQLDVFKIPIRLYQGQLHMNRLGIGLKMQEIKLPQMRLRGRRPNPNSKVDTQQINPSSIFSYLNIAGIGSAKFGNTDPLVMREFNALTLLSYWSIYKQYYANKQEEIGAVIHNNLVGIITQITDVNFTPDPAISTTIENIPYWDGTGTAPSTPIYINLGNASKLTIDFNPTNYQRFDVSRLTLMTPTGNTVNCANAWTTHTWDDANYQLILSDPARLHIQGNVLYLALDKYMQMNDIEPRIHTFPLENIDQMRDNILKWVDNTTPFTIDVSTTLEPYNLPFHEGVDVDGRPIFSAESNQEGLALKTYQSDLFNNWISTEWIDGTNGINEITKIDTSSGSFTIDELNLSKKVYEMLNRIGLSGGSYDDWLEATYDHQRSRGQEEPSYEGGLIKELVFQEVISNSESADATQPLGTLAGRGVLSGKHKGGKIVVKADEPCYVMGIISITPRVDYSQGNKWDLSLKTMDDFHKPQLDQIGFQDLPTDQLTWFDTLLDSAGNPTYKSAGKQPAWMNYMTNVSQVKGNFAIETDQMFMTLNRKYEYEWDNAQPTIKDLTTYIDPSKFNHIFANTRRDAQNFWAQIGVGIEARRKMSAKVIPNL